MTYDECKEIKKYLKKIENLALKLCFIYLFIGTAGFFIPIGLFPKAGRRLNSHITETLPSQIGVLTYIIVILLIAVVITSFMFYNNKYFDLRKDLIEQRKIKLSTTVEKIIPKNNDFGETEYDILISNNKYNIKKLLIRANMSNIDKLNLGSTIIFDLTSNAFWPLSMKILDNVNEDFSKQNINALLESIDKSKK